MATTPVGPPKLDPFNFLETAIKAVPAVKYALAVGGIIAVIVIIAGFKIDFRIAVFGVVIMLVLMTVVVVFAHLSTESKSSFHAPAVVFMWFALLLTMAIALAVFTSVFADWPAHWEGLIAVQKQSSPKGQDGKAAEDRPVADSNAKLQSQAPEHWRTVEGEFPGQFTNDWDVKFDGSTFSCPPSPAYGETLCKAVASGNTRVVHRFQTTDNNPCTFYGTVDGDFVRGTYTCSRVKGSFEWHAKIQ